MREFFRGWKRKLGVLTLLAACVLAAGWVRSIATVDLVSWPGESTNYILVSGGQQCQIIQTGSLDLEAPLWRNHGNIVHGIKLVLNEARFTRYVWISEPGARLDIFADWGDDASIIPMIPYWLLAIPLTVISLWLLLAAPRNSMQNKPDQPIAIKVT